MISVDPSSPFSQGALLGDRIRLVRPLPRPGRLHPLDGHARPSRRARRGDPPGAAAARRVRQGRRLPRDGRHRAERGRDHRHRRHRAARADARLGRLGAGAQGRDHGDSRRDRDQQDGSPGGEDDAERGALDPRRSARSATGSRRSCSPRRSRRERRRCSGRSSASTALTSSRTAGSRSGGGATSPARCSRSRPDGRRRTSRRRCASDPELRRLLDEVQRRELDPLTRRPGDHGEGVQGWRRRPHRRSLTFAPRPSGSADIARVTPVFASETLSRLRRARGAAEGGEPAAHGRVQDPRRGQHDRDALGGSARRACVAASAGNHGQAVAWAAREAGDPGDDLRAARRADGEGRRGAELRRHASSSPARCSTTRSPPPRSTWSGPGATFVHAFDDARVVAGQGTLGLELAEQLPEHGTVVIPVGGGGLAAGIAIALRELRPRAVGSSASRPPPARRSWRGTALGFTIADGIAVK